MHHPTIFSLYCQGTGWEIAADTDLKNRFWGPSIELRPVGVILLKTFDGEIYKLNKVIAKRISEKVWIPFFLGHHFDQQSHHRQTRNRSLWNHESSKSHVQFDCQNSIL